MFGPFCRRDNHSVVRGVLDKFLTHLLVLSVFLHVSLELVLKSLIRLLSLFVYILDKIWNC